MMIVINNFGNANQTWYCNVNIVYFLLADSQVTQRLAISLSV